GIDRVAPEIELELSAAHDAGHDRTLVNTDPDLPAWLEILRRQHHVVARLHAGQHRIVYGSQQARGGDERVADGLELLQPAEVGDLLEALDQPAQRFDHDLGRVVLAPWREADDVAEQDGDVGEAARPDAVGRLQLA